MYVNGTREREWGKEGQRVGKRQRQRRKNKNQHNSFPLISSVYNIKAITGCFCQRVWNNTLVSAGEMRWGRRRRSRKVERPCGWSAPSAGTKTCCCSKRCRGYWHHQQGSVAGHCFFLKKASFSLCFGSLPTLNWCFWHPKTVFFLNGPQSQYFPKTLASYFSDETVFPINYF